MLMKTMIAVVMSGALWVAGDAAYKQFGCCNQRSACNAPPSCCTITRTPSTGDCCAPESDCCEPARECCEKTTTP
jgi:hypothetical protein